MAAPKQTAPKAAPRPAVPAPPVSREGLFYGLLLAIRTQCDTFLADGARFHEAFEAALGAVRSEHRRFEKVVCALFDTRDLHGAYPAASAMVFWGLSVSILTLEAPGYSTARFSVPKAAAVKELDGMQDADVYRVMAKAFCAALA